MTLTTIRAAAPDDLDTVADLLAHAFDEPVTRWLVPDPGHHHEVMTDLFNLAATDALKAGTIDVLTDDADQPVAAALWFDYTDDLTTTAGPTQRPEPGRGWHLAFTGHDDAAARWQALDDLMSRHHLQAPHHYLFAVGVDPALQGRGLGSRLLTHRHQQLGDVPAYLEATSRDSRRLYHRHGYTDLSTISVPGAPPLFRMWLPSACLGGT